MSVSRSFAESGSPSIAVLRWKAVRSLSLSMTKMMPINEIRKADLENAFYEKRDQSSLGGMAKVNFFLLRKLSCIRIPIGPSPP